MKAVGYSLAILFVLFSSGCQSIYFSTLEQFGVHKRDILVDRGKEAQASQKEAKQQFVDALQQFKSVVNFKGGDLEAQYNRLKAQLERSEKRAAEVHERIQAVEDVAKALFKEWQAELKQYSDRKLRAASETKLDQTRARYDQLISAMKKAESRIEPVLAPMRDQVLFLKHNLNAKAIAALDDELGVVQGNVDQLVKEMETSIAEADRFIQSIQSE